MLGTITFLRDSCEMSPLKDGSLVGRSESPIFSFHFYFDLILKRFNFHTMHE